ncbi:MAG: EscU/YscU/HrcU family type III secretion system export apparatus switch protein [Gammaproteobacteria bacterium]
MGKIYHTADLAVALKYDGENPPMITAKGKGITAEQIIELAEQNGIPLRAEPELTQILSHIPLGDEIPREVYQLVAEIIAFTYFLSGKKPGKRHDT